MIDLVIKQHQSITASNARASAEWTHWWLLANKIAYRWWRHIQRGHHNTNELQCINWMAACITVGWYCYRKLGVGQYWDIGYWYKSQYRTSFITIIIMTTICFWEVFFIQIRTFTYSLRCVDLIHLYPRFNPTPPVITHTSAQSRPSPINVCQNAHC